MANKPLAWWLWRALEGPAPPPMIAQPEEVQERLLTADQVADRLAVPVDWVYRHARSLPFTVRLGAKFLRFSESGLGRYIRSREGRKR